MNRKLTLLLASTMMLGMLTLSASAAEPKDITVRVNGYAVDFQDAKPYVDDNSRTMIPVRFATESLGAEVAWDSDTQTAIIAKDGITVNVTIGSDTIKVAEGDKITTVDMDTEAIIKDNRTYVPIRFVAEALGAYVDYSDVYRTVGIYDDILTAEQISDLSGYSYTQSKGAISYAYSKLRSTPEELAYCYGINRESFTTYANAREHLYREGTRMAEYTFPGLDTVLKDATVDDFYHNVVSEAVAELTYSSENIQFHFLADISTLYQQDSYSGTTATVRGIITAQCMVAPTELTGEELSMVTWRGLSAIPQGEVVELPVDVHMNTCANRSVTINTIIPLTEQTPTM